MPGSRSGRVHSPLYERDVKYELRLFYTFIYTKINEAPFARLLQWTLFGLLALGQLGFEILEGQRPRLIK